MFLNCPISPRKHLRSIHMRFLNIYQHESILFSPVPTRRRLPEEEVKDHPFLGATNCGINVQFNSFIVLFEMNGFNVSYSNNQPEELSGKSYNENPVILLWTSNLRNILRILCLFFFGLFRSRLKCLANVCTQAILSSFIRFRNEKFPKIILYCLRLNWHAC